jgi:hypothetical protein
MNTSLLVPIIGGIIAILLIILIITIIRFNKRLTLFTNGKSGASLESTMQNLLDGHEIAKINHKKLSDFVTNIHERVIDSHRGFALLKYNAYDNVGGNQSFSLAILDENGNGMVLSNLYSRERSNVFAKPIGNFSSEIELTTEEQSVLKQARKKLT